MRQHSRFRFSLRTLLVFVAITALLSAWYRSHRAFLRSPSKSDGGGGFRRIGDPQNLRTRIFRDQNDRLVAIILLSFDEIDANGPRYSLNHGYNNWRGGRLVLDGREILQSNKPRVFANDPFGEVVELQLPTEVVQRLGQARSRAEIQAIFRTAVEPVLFQIEGDADAKGRQGLWTYRLPTGERYKEVTYSDGLRHGEMRTYYRSGRQKSRQFFDRGAPTGEWTLFDSHGGVFVKFDTRFSVHSSLHDEHGYRLYVDNAELRMPP